MNYNSFYAHLILVTGHYNLKPGLYAKCDYGAEKFVENNFSD